MLVDRVLFDGGPSGLQSSATDGAKIEAGEVTSPRALYSSPAILLRFGYRSTADLANLGIELEADLPVGQHLHDQPFSTTPTP